MISIGGISQGLTMKVKKGLPDIDEQKAEIIEYGLYMAISEIVKIATIIIISFFAGVTAYTVVTLVVFGLIRQYLGGAHANTQRGCIILYFSSIFGIVWAAHTFVINRCIMAAIVFPICFILAYIYAPADNTTKPIKSRKQRRRLRKLSFALLFIYALLSQILPDVLANITIFAALLGCIMLTPALYRILDNKYSSEEVE